MKKQVWNMAALALLLTTASCTDEQMAGGASGSEAMVTFTAQLPQGLQTKAAGDGLTATTLSYAVYQQGTTTPLITSEDEVTFVNGQATLSLRLAAGQSYDFLFWADAYGQDATDAPYTLDFNTQTLSVDYEDALSNEEARDAFFANVLALEVKGAVKQDVTLKRPFAQLNIGTDDMDEAQASGMATGSLKTSVKVAKIYKNLNLMNGQVSENTEVTFEANNIPQETFTANGQTYSYLALNYLLVATDKDLVNCEFTYTDGKLNNTMTIDNVPVQRNYRTNIFGSLLTGSVDFDITIDPDFEAIDYNYAQLLLAAQNGGKVTLTDNVTLTDEAPIVVSNGNTLEVDLAGNTITRSGEDNGQSGVWAFRVDEGTLILNDTQGTGTVDGGEGLEHSMLWANGENSKIIINSGNYTVGGNPNGNNYNVCVYASAGGQVEIYGGTFENRAPQTGSANLYPALNLSNGNPGTITVYGGTFKNYDPSTGDDSKGGTFVATGYSSVKISDEPSANGTYRVVEGTGVADSDDIASAIESGAELITLATDVTVDPATFSTIKISTIDLNGQTLSYSKATTLYVPESGNLTFRNGEIEANGFEPTQSILSANGGSTITLDGVTITTTGTGIGPSNLASNVTIEIRDSELNCGAYGFATNASMPVGSNNRFVLENSTFSANEPVFINIPCEAVINNCTLNGDTHGMVLRGGTATVTDSHITLTYTEDDYETIGSYFDDKNWGTGNMLNIAALTVGNKGTGSAYQYPSELYLVNTTVASAGDYGDYFPALYAWANQGEGLGVTITYDSDTQFIGDVVYGSSNITENGKPATVTASEP